MYQVKYQGIFIECDTVHQLIDKLNNLPDIECIKVYTKKRGRPQKYTTDAERIQAIRTSQRNYVNKKKALQTKIN
jgi:hypothetical protein